MKCILITGFEPFGGESLNPALEAVRRLEGKIIKDVRIVTRAVPVVKQKAIDVLTAAIKEVDPVLVIAVGQAAGRNDISIERVAINADDYRIPDNEGNQPVDEPVVAGGPAAYWSTLPVKAMLQAVTGGGVPASISNTAGTYVCNHLFYGLMNYLAQEGNQRRGGFLHIPLLPEQAVRNQGQPSMALDTIVRGLELAAAAALQHERDLKYAAGTVC
ncbi:MAG TPA: pyroglutamyl-peptidase I [Patescibacteria group bacterium]|nr:pyroglutamyl-peptidase I [Patescibacteria group bacterium]